MCVCVYVAMIIHNSDVYSTDITVNLLSKHLTSVLQSLLHVVKAQMEYQDNYTYSHR